MAKNKESKFGRKAISECARLESNGFKCVYLDAGRMFEYVPVTQENVPVSKSVECVG